MSSPLAIMTPAQLVEFFDTRLHTLGTPVADSNADDVRAAVNA